MHYLFGFYLLVECCFVDDKDDIKIYDSKKMAKAIAEGILNRAISKAQSTTEKYKNGGGANVGLFEIFLEYS